MPVANANIDRFKKLLSELFMFDRADLDFGIYRIMNTKRAEITRFLDEELLPQVRAELEKVGVADRTEQESALRKLEKQLADAGVSPDASPRVVELRAQLAKSADLEGVKDDVFSHLADFFARYYKEGDFLSLRRYKKGVYALPYEGEEVKLHWANADQFYIKSSEYFRDYAFRLDDGRTVHFKLVAADTEQNNNKAIEGERVFVLAEDTPVQEQDGALVVRFEYQPNPQKRKQAELNTSAAQRVLADEAAGAWVEALGRKEPTEKNAERTLLERRIGDYAARNTFDYFIHRDLRGFLRRELSFYIKNEVMRLDDLEDADVPRVEQYLGVIRAIRGVGHKIIDMLAHLEDFQKRLWLKKKFVVETNYCITLDRVPKDLYTEIAANDAQREEWVRLFAIDEIKGSMFTPSYTNPLPVEFLEANQSLQVDTRFFDNQFKARLLASFENLDDKLDGLLVHSENFGALNFLQERYRGQVKCAHIDPPYNTDTSGFLYKNNYKHSSWLSMMADRIGLAISMLTKDGAFLCHIDENEYERLQMLLYGGGLFNSGTVIWDKKNPMLGKKGVATQHEYVCWWSFVDKPIYMRRVTINLILNTVQAIIARHGGVTEATRKEFSKWISSQPGLSGGERAYKYLDDDGRIYQSVAMGAPEPRTNEKFFVPLIHPITKKPCPVPASGWSRAPETIQELIEKNEIIFGADETTQPRRKVFLSEESQRQLSSVISDSSRGKADAEALGLEFPYSHPVSLYMELLGAATGSNDAVIDFFAGSGTTGHAVIDLNREDGGTRKYQLVEVGEYFYSVTKPRIQKVVYSKTWKDGKPVGRDGTSHMLKYIRLESYEDTLNNLELRRTPEQQALLDMPEAQTLREDYLLHYIFDAESGDALLDIDGFAEPFSYQLKIASGSVNETQPTNIDLVETFNYLLGLRVQSIREVDGVRLVRGIDPTDARVLVIWRSLGTTPNEKLDELFQTLRTQPDFADLDVVYVNGDNNLESLRADTETWKVRLIEEEFKTRMFDTSAVVGGQTYATQAQD